MKKSGNILLRAGQANPPGVFRSRIYVLAAFVAFALLMAGPQVRLAARERPLYVVTTTTDLAYIAGEVGGDRVETRALLRGSEDPHYAQARPDYIVHLNRADVFVEVGMELEVGWSPVLLRSARNSQIIGGAPGYCDASIGVKILERPKGTVTRAMGDVHVLGNPHYWTDPLNASIIARNIRDALVRVNPAGRKVYQANYARFHERMKSLTIEESKKFAATRGIKVAVYHREFSYLANRFGIEIVASIEEVPGSPPSAAYLREVTELLEAENVKLILVAPFNNRSYADAVAERIGARVVVMPLSVGSEPGVDAYADTIRVMLERVRGHG